MTCLSTIDDFIKRCSENNELESYVETNYGLIYSIVFFYDEELVELLKRHTRSGISDYHFVTIMDIPTQYNIMTSKQAARMPQLSIGFDRIMHALDRRMGPILIDNVCTLRLVLMSKKGIIDNDEITFKIDSVVERNIAYKFADEVFLNNLPVKHTAPGNNLDLDYLIVRSSELGYSGDITFLTSMLNGKLYTEPSNRRVARHSKIIESLYDSPVRTDKIIDNILAIIDLEGHMHEFDYEYNESNECAYMLGHLLCCLRADVASYVIGLLENRKRNNDFLFLFFTSLFFNKVNNNCSIFRDDMDSIDIHSIHFDPESSAQYLIQLIQNGQYKAYSLFAEIDEFLREEDVEKIILMSETCRVMHEINLKKDRFKKVKKAI